MRARIVRALFALTQAMQRDTPMSRITDPTVISATEQIKSEHPNYTDLQCLKAAKVQARKDLREVDRHHTKLSSQIAKRKLTALCDKKLKIIW